jgi:hypothetical protein
LGVASLRWSGRARPEDAPRERVFNGSLRAESDGNQERRCSSAAIGQCSAAGRRCRAADYPSYEGKKLLAF